MGKFRVSLRPLPDDLDAAVAVVILFCFCLFVVSGRLVRCDFGVTVVCVGVGKILRCSGCCCCLCCVWADGACTVLDNQIQQNWLSLKYETS